MGRSTASALAEEPTAATGGRVQLTEAKPSCAGGAAAREARCLHTFRFSCHSCPAVQRRMVFAFRSWIRGLGQHVGSSQACNQAACGQHFQNFQACLLYKLESLEALILSRVSGSSRHVSLPFLFGILVHVRLTRSPGLGSVMRGL